jgi:hypothetical protein
MNQQGLQGVGDKSAELKAEGTKLVESCANCKERGVCALEFNLQVGEIKCGDYIFDPTKVEVGSEGDEFHGSSPPS